MSIPMQKATYVARAVSVAFGVSSNGNYEIGVTVRLVADELAGEEITWVGHFTEKTQSRTIESLQHFGWQGDDLSELDGLDDESCARMLPNDVEIVCDVEEYKGEAQLRVKWINRPGAGRFAFKDKLEGAQLKGFAAQMRGVIRNARGAAGAKASAPKHPNAPGNRGDIPF